MWRSAPVSTLEVLGACQQQCKLCMLHAQNMLRQAVRFVPKHATTLCNRCKTWLPLYLTIVPIFLSERNVGPTYRGNGQTSHGGCGRFWNMPKHTYLSLREVLISCREQLAEAMHRVDALLVDMDDVRRSASEETAAATERADASEGQLKCAYDCCTTSSCRIPCTVSQPSLLLTLAAVCGSV